MDKIYIKGLKIFAFHGVNIEEKQNGQNFILDIKIKADLEKARNTDKLDETINYAKVRKTIDKVFTAEKYDLIEHAAQVVGDEILREYSKIKLVTVKVKKPEAPMNANFSYVAVKVKVRRTN